MKRFNRPTVFVVTALSALLLAGCGDQDATDESADQTSAYDDSQQGETAGQPESAQSEDAQPSQSQEMATGHELNQAIEQAVAHAGRPDDDRERDANRKPAEVLAFFGIRPGMRVFEYQAGSGYYTEILSYVVGPTGEVIAHNSPAFAQFYSEGMEQRLARGAFGNVTHHEVAPDELDLEPNSIDAALITLAYHDLFFTPEDGAELPDRNHLLAELHEALKPGAVLGVVDHVGPEGADPYETGQATHRIDPEFVRQEIEEAGFVLAGTSDLLHNPDDDMSVPFWELDRGTTDRFVFRFETGK